MTPIKYLWHLHGEAWQKVLEKINVPKTIKAVHERYLGANNRVERKRGVLPFGKKNDKMAKED